MQNASSDAVSIDIVVNGQPRTVPRGASIAMLLTELQLDPRHLAVEVNMQLAPRTQHAEFVLSPGDRVEVVTLVGGG